MSHRQYWLLNGMRTATHSENEILFLMHLISADEVLPQRSGLLVRFPGHRQVLEGEHE